jgi:hypothetical protein
LEHFSPWSAPTKLLRSVRVPRRVSIPEAELAAGLLPGLLGSVPTRKHPECLKEGGSFVVAHRYLLQNHGQSMTPILGTCHFSSLKHRLIELKPRRNENTADRAMFLMSCAADPDSSLTFGVRPLKTIDAIWSEEYPSG